jgi:hypothetical protein
VYLRYEINEIMTDLLLPHACVGDMRDGDKVATADGAGQTAEDLVCPLNLLDKRIVDSKL